MDETKSKPWVLTVLLFLAVFIFWCGFWFIITRSGFVGWEQRGQFGDSFGALNTLFSGLAFAGLITALYLQRTELEYQRQELQETRKELKGTREAQELTAHLLRDQVQSQSRANERAGFHSILYLMEPVRKDRACVRQLDRVGKKWSELAQNDLEALDRVCRAFDELGFLDRTGLVDQKLVDGFYSSPLVLLWKGMMSSYVEDLRQPEKRGPTHFWELVQFYERVKEVPENHPAKHGESDWVPNPREKRAKIG